MANWCFNNVFFYGDAAAVEKVVDFFKNKQENKCGGERHWLPPFVINISITDDNIHYHSRWIPNNEALVQVATQYGVDFINRYNEFDRGIFGEADYRNTVFSNIRLDTNDFKSIHYDKETQRFIYNDRSYEDERPIFVQLLAQKKLNSPYFKTTSTVTKEQLTECYGELLPGDIVLKLAEHKNFVKANEAFREMDEGTISEIDRVISANPHTQENYETQDKFLAVSFLKLLISEWNKRHRDNEHQANRGM